ncbi:MAG: glycoside hydrolase [candidate division KSB1 bacterium]|nr:glycoside hydrolase [candidate division KSB1 bacterium]
MMKFLILFFILLDAALLPAQNLLTNPGFEGGMNGWNELWTREPGAGQAAIVEKHVYTGTHALHIEHWGEKDWSFEQSKKISANPGEIYDFSARILAVQLRDWAELSVILYDEQQNVLNWAHGSRYFESGETYSLFSSRFVIPENVACIRARFIGAGTCELYIDEVSLQLQGALPDEMQYSLENDHLSVNLTVPSMALDIIDKDINQTYEFSGVSDWIVSQVDSAADSLAIHATLLSSDLEVMLSLHLRDKTIAFKCAGDSAALLNYHYDFPGFATSRDNDYLVIPWAAGMLLPVQEEFPFWEFSLYDWKATMGFAGVTNLENGYMLYTQDPWDTMIRSFKPQDSNFSSLQMRHLPVKGTFGYTRHFYLSFFASGGYVSMAQRYRSFAEQQGYVKPFSEKMYNNPNVAKLEGAVDFWALHPQFRSPAFIDSLLLFGMDRGIISLGGGWNNETDLTDVIQHINNHGLLSSRYDIFTDVWPPTHPEKDWYRTDGYPEDVIVNRDGSLREGWLAYLDDGTPFQGYYTCSATHPNYAHQRLTDDLAENLYNARFIDVELASALVECYSTVHPTTRRQDGRCRVQALNVVKNEFNLVTGSEEARDFAFPVVDYGEGTLSIMPSDHAGYDWATPVTDPGDEFIDYNMNPARRIPLHGLVYHDVHVPTWYTGDGLSKVPEYWLDKELYNILYASMPLIMPPSPQYWRQHRERFITSMNLVSAVTRSCGFAAMTAHDFLSADKRLQRTRIRVTVGGSWSISVMSR